MYSYEKYKISKMHSSVSVKGYSDLVIAHLRQQVTALDTCLPW